MKNLQVATIFLMLIILASCSGTKKITVTADSGSQIFVDGRQIASGTAKIKVPKKTTVNVQVKKPGFITAERNYQNVKTIDLPKSEYIKLDVDDAFENSISTDIANRDIEIRTNPKKSEEEIWLLLNRVVLDHFDVLETADLKTGYLRTAWTLNKFKAASVRTRLIVKFAGDNPLTYKVKLMSEIAPPLSSVKADELYQEWDRILRVYEPVIDDLRSRLAK
jgi:hypothetical protein